MIACPICHIEYEQSGLRYCSRCGSDIGVRATTEGADAWIGQVIDGRYRVQARVGTGGMGAVYRIEHVRMGKVAAMKVLHRELAKDEQVVKRFRREVEVVSKLNHPNIVQTFDFGYWEGLLYLIMEYVKGDDLGALLRREGPLAVPRAFALGVQVCSALDEAHHHGVVHRDLKPENIVCTRRREEEHAKVLDFGLAKLRERPELGEITGAGSLVGTPYYMSPEQVRSENIDHRTDLYSLGATLYRVVTGMFAFEGTSPMGILSKHLTDELVAPSVRVPRLGLTAEVDRVIMRAMARNRDERYESAASMRRDLEAVLGVPSLERTPESPPRKTRSLASRAMKDDAREILPIADDIAEAEGSDAVLRLGRDEFDAFERKERSRRRVASFVVTPLLIAGLALAGWGAFRFLRPRPTTIEKEPNDVSTMATLLPRAKLVSGRVGNPHTSGEPDFDYYRIPAGPGPRAVTARLGGVPDLDLVLELYDERGRQLAKADNGRVGASESLGPVAIGNGDSFIRVHPVWTSGGLPTPGSPTPYELQVDWAKPRPDWELEPNDTPETANKIDKDNSVEGYLSSPADEDWFRVKVPAGMRLDGRVDGIDGIDVDVLIGSERKRTDTASYGEHEPFSATPGKDGIVLVGVVESAAKKPSKRPPPVADRDEPYTIKFKFRAPDSDRP